MSFFKSLKRSFGFGGESDDELYSDSPDIAGSDGEGREVSSRVTGSDGQSDNGEPEPNPQMVTAIFDYVIATFNEAMPSFIRDSLDPEVQRRKLYEGLDTSIREYISALGVEARRRSEARFAAEQCEMRAEMDSLKAKAKEIEQQRFDIKQQQLSADRQKRALSDRVHDLEAQIVAIEADREQLDLENKSLLNKLKVASIHENDAEAMREQISDLQRQLLELRNTDTEVPSDGDRQAVSDDSDRLAEELESVKSELTETRSALEATKAAFDEAVAKEALSREMVTDLQRRASEAREELDRRNSECKALQASLDESRAMNDEVVALSEQMDKIEQAVGKRDRLIEKLKADVAALTDENASLRVTIADNIANSAETEAALRQRIDELESVTVAPVVSSELETYVKSDGSCDAAADSGQHMPKISDKDLREIEESFESADWMRSDPPADVPSMRSEVKDSDFGYQAPVRKTHNTDNDAQLSLFD